MGRNQALTNERYRPPSVVVVHRGNLAREWNDKPPSPAGYVKLLQACYEAIKQADPSAVVISAGLAPTGGDGTANAVPDEPYLWGMYAAGLAKYSDVLGLNAPGYKS